MLEEKVRDDNPPVPRLLEQPSERPADVPLGIGVAGALGVGRLAQHAQDPLLAQLGEPRQVDHLPLNRGVVDLEVAGVDDDAHRGGDGKGHRIGDRMVDMDCLDGEGPQLDDVPRHKLHEFCLAGQAVLLQLPVDQPQRQLGAVDRDIGPEFFQEIGHRPDVVLVPVGDDHPADLLFVLFEIGEVGDDQVDPQHLRIGKPIPQSTIRISFPYS